MKFEDMINKIILGDCMNYLKEIPDKSIDLVLTDPPYGINADKGVGGFGASPLTAKKYDNDGDDRFHPTQKPYRLISEIIKDYSEENDLILDAFSESGTVCCAAKDLKKKFIGFEINEKFYKKSIDRLNGINSNGQYTIFAYENGENK